MQLIFYIETLTIQVWTLRNLHIAVAKLLNRYYKDALNMRRKTTHILSQALLLGIKTVPIEQSSLNFFHEVISWFTSCDTMFGDFLCPISLVSCETFN